MSTLPALASGLQGIQQGLKGLDRDAARIASARQFTSGDPAGLADPLVDLQQQRLQVQAAAAVVRSADQALGSLIDVLA